MSITDIKNNPSQELYNGISKLKNKTEIREFLQELMTSAEIKDITVRFKIAKKLVLGISQRSIAKKLKISVTTVTRVNKNIKKKNSNYIKVINRLNSR